MSSAPESMRGNEEFFFETVMQHSWFVPHAQFTFTRLVFFFVFLPVSQSDVGQTLHCRKGFGLSVGTVVAFITPKLNLLCMYHMKMSHIPFLKSILQCINPFSICYKVFYMNLLSDGSFSNTNSSRCLLPEPPIPLSSVTLHHCLLFRLSWLFHTLFHSILPFFNLILSSFVIIAH